ncbi:MAG: ABC transporter ATP-binding protein [Bacteroidetes bacterium]|nr:ABC transporter ATP-binding protein [Bacteroidota bacterium]HET6244373.1 ABC transporter ATP-binding protein [Bacteroidia bacterium]
MKSLKYLNKYFLKYRFRFLFGTLFVIISNLFAVYAPQVIRHTFDLVKETYDVFIMFEGFALQSSLIDFFAKTAFFLGMLYISLAIFRGVFLFLMRQTLIVMSRHIEYDLKNEIFNHYQNLSLSFYKKNNTGDLMNRISEDVSRVRMYFGPAIMYSINLITLFVLVITAMLTVNPKLTFYVLLPLPFLSFAIYFVSSVINKKSEAVQRQLSRLSTFTQEAFSGIRVLKAYNREAFSANEFDRESEIYKEKSMGLVKTNALFFPFMMLLIGLSTLLTVFIGGMEAIAGNISIGNIAEFIVYVNLLTWPVAAVGWVTSIIQRAAASQQRINEFLHTSSDISAPDVPPISIKGKIEFNNVSFRFSQSTPFVLKNISLSILPGQTIAIVGKTGSGKSTMANLITRLYDVTEGELLIDEKPIKKINLNSLRSSIGYVPQDVFLFSDTIANNIAFGERVDDSDMELIENAAKSAVIYDNIMAFPKGFNTLLGERGITLSGGQKQRVSIARAIIKKPSILIFDDCFSAVDTETEEKILNNLKDIIREKSCIIVSHRVSTVKHADKIIVLEDGRIIEEGNHQALIQEKGTYFELYQKQLLEELKN